MLTNKQGIISLSCDNCKKVIWSVRLKTQKARDTNKTYCHKCFLKAHNDGEKLGKGKNNHILRNIKVFVNNQDIPDYKKY